MLSSEKLLASLLAVTRQQAILQRHQAMDVLQASEAFSDPKSLIPHGQKVYSQNEEDGILFEIFQRIGTTNRTFVEFGIGNGLENNTLALLLDAWHGLWIEGSSASVAGITHNMPRLIKSGRLQVREAFITVENINALISGAISEQEIDLLSIDIDGNDFHVLEAITCVKPRVIVIEYNAKFPPPIEYCMVYQPAHVWNKTDNFGVSLAFLDKQLGRRDYCLVACNLTGSNAFFVRKDCVGEHFHQPYTAEHHYQPARYYLCGLNSGHPADYATIDNNLYASET